MAQRELGSTGLKAFPLGLGTVKLGRNRDVKYPTGFDLPDDAAVQRLLHVALDLGIEFFDTAPAYGASEQRLGPFVRANRDRIVLCSKAGEEWGPDGSSHDFSPDGLGRSVEASLRRLQTDHLDLLLLHSDGRDREILEGDAIESLRRIRESGKARAVGASVKTPEGIRIAARELDAVMAPFGVAHPDFGPELAAARRSGCATIAIKVLGQGHVVDAGDDPVQVALEHVLTAEGIDLAVIGTINPVHLEAAVERTRTTLDATA